MNNELDKYLKTDRELAIKTRITNSYLGQIFSNTNIRFDYDYIISAMYTEMMIQSGFDGILYPSVKSQGRGYNICLSQKCVDQKLKLKVAGEGRILKAGYLSRIVAEKQAKIIDDSCPFEYEQVENYRNPSDILQELYDGYS